MPRKQMPKLNKKPRRKAYRKPKKNYKSRIIRDGALMPSISSPLPTAFKTILRYNEITKLGALGVSTDKYILRSNSLFDPDYSFGGHQPRGFDQLMQMYNKYTVIGSKLTATFTNQNTTPGIVGIAERSDAPNSLNWSDYIEGSQRVVYKQISAASGANNSITIVDNHSPRKFFSKSKVLDVPELKGTVASNPGLSSYWHLFYYDMGMQTVANAIYITYQVEFIVVFTEPAPPASS